MRKLGQLFNEGDQVTILGRAYRSKYNKQRFLDIRLYDELKPLVENLTNPILADHLYLEPENLQKFKEFQHYGHDLVVLTGTIQMYYRISINDIDVSLDNCRISTWYAYDDSTKTFRVLSYKNDEVQIVDSYNYNKYFAELFNPYIVQTIGWSPY